VTFAEPLSADLPASRVKALAAIFLRRRGAVPALLYPPMVPVVYIVGRSFDYGVSPHAAFRSLLVAVVGALLLLLALTALLRNVHRAAIAMLLLYLLGFSLAVPAVFAVLIPAAILVVMIDRLPSRRIGWARLSVWFSTLTSAMLVVVLAQAALSGQLARAVAGLAQGGDLPAATSTGPIDPTKPDVYVIVLDGYARRDTLQNSLHFDDGPFLDQLESRGFDVASDSQSNYPFTAQTFVTMLNMDYLDQIPEVAHLQASDPTVSSKYRQALNENRAFQLFREQGYQIVSTGSGWESLAIRQSDVYLDGGQLNSFEATMLRDSGLGWLIQHLSPDWGGDQSRSRIDSDFEELRQVAQTPSSQPRLVVAHVLAPHPPLVYGPNGERLPVDLSDAFAFDWATAGLNRQNRTRYTGQIAYLDRQVLPVVDALISAARRPAVIVLMSDHGARLDTAAGSTAMSPEADHNFFATLTPGHPGLFGASPTPVNLFRRVLDTYLGSDLAILPNHSFTSSWDKALTFTPLPSPSP